ncbi:ABC transporter substrate-binding protein [Bradyrhizobium diazoefficiens]|uniref:ABC transporter substrate-binding protein n=1 Tax=Bradyrhizobium diazoefficiens TaxID=1355477 RepID=UPI00190D9FCA|nr:ABC transporter substrate-binding protein [Bradyrhizobium diazoefficiens]QQO13875.1 ABC transporter substrate-binding protein [Bradyrhizobium diazoefficiens]
MAIEKTMLSPARRAFVKSIVGGVASLAAPFIHRGYAAEQLVVRDPGGVVNDAAIKAFYKPFTEETGVNVVGVTSQLEPLSQIRTIVDSKSYLWDIALLSMQAQRILGEAGYLNEIDLNAPGIRDILSQAKSKWGVGVQIYATVFAYNTQTYGDKALTSWADVFDLKKFPGRRGLRKYPIDTLESAVMADGVSPRDVYPLDLERAFAKLDQVKPGVDVWWSNGAQSSQIASSREVDIVSTWNGRIQAAIDDGAPYKIVWNQGIWAADGYAIPKGNPKAKLCHDFLTFCARPGRQAEFSKWVPYSPPNPKAFEFIDKARIPLMPTAPGRLEHMLMESSNYWAEHLEKVTARFNEWIVK